MTYCSHCGNALAHDPPVRCQVCGAEHYRNAKPTGGALVTRGRELLLIRRASDPWTGYWNIPGGFAEVDEHPMLTAEREVYEETGVRCEVTGWIGAWLAEYAHNGGHVWALNTFWHAVPLDEPMGDPDPAEVLEVAWFDADALPEVMSFPEYAYEVLAAWRADLDAGTTRRPLPDRPERPAP